MYASSHSVYWSVGWLVYMTLPVPYDPFSSPHSPSFVVRGRKNPSSAIQPTLKFIYNKIFGYNFVPKPASDTTLYVHDGYTSIEGRRSGETHRFPPSRTWTPKHRTEHKAYAFRLDKVLIHSMFSVERILCVLGSGFALTLAHCARVSVCVFRLCCESFSQNQRWLHKYTLWMCIESYSYIERYMLIWERHGDVYVVNETTRVDSGWYARRTEGSLLVVIPSRALRRHPPPFHLVGLPFCACHLFCVWRMMVRWKNDLYARKVINICLLKM